MVIGIVGCFVSIACTSRDATVSNEAPAPPSQSASEPARENVGASSLATGVETSPSTATQPTWRQSVQQYAIVQLKAPSFEKRTPKEQHLAYHWVRAARAGHPISLDQRHRLGWPLRAALDAVVSKKIPGDSAPDRALVEYTRQLWIANGPYDRDTGKKLRPEFGRDTWRNALKSIPGVTSGWGPDTGRDLEALLFDPSVDTQLVSRDPQGRVDPLMGSGSNLYRGVRLSDLKDFEFVYPFNSRLVKRNGQLVEEVYRAGRTGSAEGRPAPAGRYGTQLAAVCGHLRQGLPLASEEQQMMHRHLIEHLESGDAEAFDRFNRAWLKDDSPVQFMAGFIETGLDPRGVKGEWEATVMVRDEQVSRWIAAIAASAQYFEDRSPWDAAFKKTWEPMVLPQAVEVLAGSGGTAPVLPTVIDLPNNPRIREQNGTRTLWLTNVIRAIDGAVRERGVDAFMLPRDRGDAHRYGAIIDGLELVLHEVLGHGSGKVTEQFDHKQPAVALREYATALEEARAMLVALHHFWDPRLRTIAPECPDACAASAMAQLVSHDLMMLRWVHRDRLEDDHRRAVHLIVQYARAKGAVGQVEKDGHIFQHITDMGLWRSAVKTLLGELMRIKATGDYQAARTLFEQFGLTVDVRVRDQVAARAHRIGLPGRYAFIMPTLRLEQGNVRLHSTETFLQQQLAYPVPVVVP